MFLKYFKYSNRLLIICVGLICSFSAFALPIDWNGSLVFDTLYLKNFRRTNDAVATANTPNGTQGIQDGDNSANFQTYLFKLNPQMIVNDAVTVKGEFSSGHIRGGLFGGDSTQNQDPSTPSGAYFSTVPAQRSALNVNQLYAELYADAALLKIGRFAKGFGSGSILNEGTKATDRFFTQYDGAQAEVRLGSFSITPHWARLSTYDEAREKASENGQSDVKEMGLVAAYDNTSTNFTLQVAYAKRFSDFKNSLYNSNNSTVASFNRSRSRVNLINAYLEKKWEKVRLTVDVPTMSGNIGNVYDNTTESNLSAKAILTEAVWSPNKKWDYGFHAGQVDGDDGTTGRFEGLYLHPNYHFTQLMFRYNYAAFNEGKNSVFDASVTNTRFFKLYTNYHTDRWTWSLSYIHATALETAENGKQAYNHEKAYRYTANADQADDYGSEINAGFVYEWNPNVKFTGNLAYWMVGDYYAFTNSATELDLKDVFGSQFSVAIEF